MSIDVDMVVDQRNMVQLYFTAETFVDWFSQFAGVFGERTLSLNSQMLYTAPNGANFWRRMSSGGNSKAYFDLKESFVKNYKKLVSGLSSDSINVIDLGVGDFRKGKLTLEYYLDERKAQGISYFALDVSYDMLRQAFASSVKEDGNILGRVKEQGSVVGINSSFSYLRRYKTLFSQGNNIFLLLGNTLGNVRELQTLSDIRNGMNNDDTLMVDSN